MNSIRKLCDLRQSLTLGKTTSERPRGLRGPGARPATLKVNDADDAEWLAALPAQTGNPVDFVGPSGWSLGRLMGEAQR